MQERKQEVAEVVSLVENGRKTSKYIQSTLAHSRGFDQSAQIFQHLQRSCLGGVLSDNSGFFLFLHKNIHCGYSLEVPHQGASNEYPQPMFSLRT